MDFNLSNKRSKRKKRQSKTLHFENLESRRMLSVNCPADGAEIILVTTTADLVSEVDGLTSLREAISLANSDSDANTITFANGVGDAFENDALIRLTQGELVITEELTIDGSTVGGELVITGDSNGDDSTLAGTNVTDVSASFGGVVGAADDLLDDNSRVFNVFEAPSATFVGLTITGGRTNTGTSSSSTFLDAFGRGGGVLSSSSDLAFVATNVIGNSTIGLSSHGGGISITAATLTLDDSQVSGNSTSGRSASGGGISVFGSSSTRFEMGSRVTELFPSTAILNNTVVTGNSSNSDDGGGIQSSFSTLVINDSVVSGNSASGRGGGISSVSTSLTLLPSSVSLNRSTVSGNVSNADGGGLDVSGTSSLEISGSTISGNSTTGDTGNPLVSASGGGVNSDAITTVTNSTISGNSANWGGGLILFSDFVISQSTVTGNIATQGGGLFALTNIFETSSAINSIFLGNVGTLDGANVVNDITSNVSDDGGNILGGVDPSLVFAETNAFAEGSSVLAGVLRDNGGPVQTVALLADELNPALDVGDAPVDLVLDAAGNVRAFDIIGLDNGGLADAGAVELLDPFNISPSASGIPANVSVLEDTSSNVDLSGVNFVDVNDDVLTVVLAASDGTLSATSGSNVEVTGSGTEALSLVGTAGDINAFLDSTSAIQYTAALNANDAATITISADDATGVDNNDGETVVQTVTVSTDNTGELFSETAGVLTDFQLFDDDFFSLTTTPFDSSLGTLNSFTVTFSGISVSGNGTTSDLFGSLSSSLSGQFTVDGVLFNGTGSNVFEATEIAGDPVEFEVLIDFSQTFFVADDGLVFGDPNLVGAPFDPAILDTVTGADPFEILFNTAGTVRVTDVVDVFAEASATISIEYDFTPDVFTDPSGDGTAGSVLGTISVDITPVNDPAVISGVFTATIEEDAVTPAIGQVSVVDGDAGESKFVAGQQVGALGTFDITTDGQWSYTLDNVAADSLRAGADFREVFVVTAFDGTVQNFLVTVNGVNDVAEISGELSVVTNEDMTTVFRGALSVADVDSGQAFFNGNQSVGNFGSFEIGSNGGWIYNVDNAAVAGLNATQSVVDTFEITTGDGTAASFTVVIEGRNDHFDDFVTTDAGESVTFNVLDNDEFAGDVSIVSNLAGSGGAISIGDNGNLTFTPADGFDGLDSFQLTFEDEAGNIDRANVLVTVNAVVVDDTNIFGTSNDDILEGTLGDDNIVGGLGSDLLIGSAGNDVFTTDEINGDNDRNDKDVISLGNVDGNNTGNDVITDFDINRANGGENSFDTLDFTFGGIDFSLATRNEILDFVDFIESDGDVSTDAILDGSDLIFVFGRDSGNPDIITSSIRLEDVLGRNGLNTTRLGDNSVDALGSSELDVFAADGAVEVGSNANDSLTGDLGNDVIVGGLGSDTLFGGAGNDVLTGDQSDGDNNRSDQDTFVLGDVGLLNTGNDVITDFDTNNFNGGELNFDTLSLSLGGQDFSLSTGSDILDFANLLESDGNNGTGTLIDGDDIIFVFGRNDQGIITDSVRFEDIIGDDGLTDSVLAAFDAIGESGGFDVFDS